MREREGYREVLESILSVTNGKHLLNITEVVKFTGRSRNTVIKRFPFINGEITAEVLALQLVGGKR